MGCPTTTPHAVHPERHCSRKATGCLRRDKNRHLEINMIEKPQKTTLLAVLSALMVIAGAEISMADSPKPKMNYLKSVIQHSPDGLEKDFLLRLEKRPDLDALIDSLGIMQIHADKPFGTMQQPGKSVEPLLFDDGEVKAINFRRTLAWHQAFLQAGKKYQLLIFDSASKRWPGTQPITIVLVDDNLDVLSWLAAGGGAIFERANLQVQQNQKILEVIGQNRSNSESVERFEIEHNAIKKLAQ